MKLKLEDKLKIIEMYQEGQSIPMICKKFKVCKSVVERIERQKQEIELLKAKVEFLSLLRRAEREASWKEKSKKKKSSK